MKSKLYFLLTILIFGATTSFAQTIIINHGERGVSGSLKKLKKGRTYEVKLGNVHSGIMLLKSEVLSYDLVSSSTDITKFLAIPSTASLQANIAFSQVKKDTLEVGNNLERIIKRIDRYDNFYRQMIDSLGVHFKKWPEHSIKNAELQAQVLELSETVFNQTIEKSEILKIRSLLEENELWVIYINNIITRDITSLSSIDLYSKFIAKRGLLKQNSSNYVQAILTFHGIINPINTVNIEYLQGDKFTVKGDLTNIKYAIQNKLTSDTLAIGSLQLPTYDYWTFDFSTGFYWNKLTNDSFTLSQYNVDSTSITFQKDYGKSSDIAFGGQLNLTYMASGHLGIGINTGAAVSLYDGSTKYLLGGHIKIGSRNQLMLSGGITIGKVKRVSDVIMSDPIFRQDNNTIIVPSRFTELKLVDKVETSIFIGLSYNLSGVLKKRK